LLGELPYAGFASMTTLIEFSMLISETATHRLESFFSQDMAACQDAIREAVTGKRILAVGAAGSIGTETVKVLASYAPEALHIVDQNENTLAELVRQFRSEPDALQTADFRTLPLDYGSAAMLRLMQQENYDRILNFAAIKHVRSEKDVFSVLQMLDTNIVKQARFRDFIAETNPAADYFSVSTDKAANPVSFMGATKRIMEHVLFDGAREAGLTGKVTTARFANVAYSNGSLLQSFQNRLARGQALAAPQGVRRYFVSLEESGQICTLASIIPEHAHITVPKLDPEEHLITLQSVGERFLAAHDLKPRLYDEEDAAIRAVETCLAKGEWPLLITPSNTAGEKPYEEFVGHDEVYSEIGLNGLGVVEYRAPQAGASVPDLVAKLADVVGGKTLANKEEVKAMIAQLEPRFLDDHIDSKANLDQRV